MEKIFEDSRFDELKLCYSFIDNLSPEKLKKFLIAYIRTNIFNPKYMTDIKFKDFDNKNNLIFEAVFQQQERVVKIKDGKINMTDSKVTINTKEYERKLTHADYKKLEQRYKHYLKYKKYEC